MEMIVAKEGAFKMRRTGINALPDGLHGKILSLLPIKDAIRTSVLSKDWRFRWTKIPKLVLDESLFPEARSQEEYERKVVNFANRFLLAHDGPIKTFKFQLPLKTCSSMDAWMPFLRKNGVEKVFLMFDHQERGEYTVHSSVFHCCQLFKLDLSNCMVKLPSDFKGLERLYKLVLYRVSFGGSHDIERLVANSPNLDHLSVESCEGYSDLNISCKSLSVFQYVGRFTNIFLEFTVQDFLEVNFLERPLGFADHECCRLIEFLDGQTGITSLTFDNHSLGHFATANIPSQFPRPFEFLHNISIRINLECLKQTLAVFCLLRSCPVLERLDLQSFSFKFEPTIGNFWKSEAIASCEFKQLKHFGFSNITGRDPDMKFIEFVLANAPVLEKAHIKLEAGKTDLFDIARNLNSFKRASALAVVLC